MAEKQCGSCSGAGMIRRGKELVTCPTCKGTGRVGTADPPRRRK